jgi:autotransporter-associated beta strand protein
MPFLVPAAKSRFTVQHLLFLLCFLCLFAAQSAFAQTAAFPGAQGFGQNATGGRNGTVYHVTSLNDSGTGTFRDAVSKANRTIVFDIGGTINLASAVSCANNLTIAGQTAPGGGIALVGHEISFSAKTNEIVRFLRIRPGSIAASTEDGINLGDGTNMIFDHISIEFAPYNSIDAHGSAGGANNITFQSCMLADPIGQQFNAHTEAVGNTFAWCYNLFTSGHNRNPLAKVNTIYINNVVYNYQSGYTVANTSGHFTHDIINNYFITGPSTSSPGDDFFQMNGNQQIYSAGNILDSDKNGQLSGSATAPSGVVVLGSPWSSLTPNIPTRSTVDGYKYAVSLSGALPRDQVDHLVVADITSLGTSGHMWTSQTQTGLGNNGFGTVPGGPTPVNTSGDGMADFWKLANGLNVNTAYPLTNTADGYTLLEHYLNWLAAPHALANTNTAVTVDLAQYSAGFPANSTYTITGTSNGVAVLTNASSVIFTPNNNLIGLGGFTFTVSDGATTLTNAVGIGVTPISVPLDLTWHGDGVANNWDATTANWLSNGTNAAFAQDDTVTFDDTGSATPAINLVGSLIPADITINSTQNYTFSGTGSISGSAPFTKSGSGTLTLNTTNSGFSGSINLNGGAVVVGSGASIGSGNITMSSNTTLTVSSGATSITTSGAITVAAGSTATLASGQLGNEFSGTISSGDNTSVLNLGGGCSFNGSASSQFSSFTGTINIPSGSTLRFAVQSSGNKFGSLNPNFIINGTLQPRNAGNTITLGTLNGSGQLTGPQTTNTGSGATLYMIGGNNQNGNFSGTIISNINSAGSAICFDKVGTGTQVLSGNNTMTGTNAVLAGTLLLNGSNIPSLLTVFSGATLGGTGTINGPITVNSGGILSPGPGVGSVGTLTLGSNLSLTSPTLNFDLSSSPSGPNDQIVMNGGSLNMTGTQNYQFNLLNGALNNGTYVLITGATNASAASFAINLPSGARQTFAMQSPAPNTGAGYVWLVVSGSPAASLVWQGTNGNNWDTSTVNWLNGSVADTYFNLDSVLFDDTSTNGNVNVTGTLQPGQVVAANSATTYTLSGGALAGGMQFVQNGSGAFILNNTNSYTGGTMLNSGSVVVSNTAAVGNGPLFFNGGEFTFAGPSLSTYSNALIFLSNSGVGSSGGGNNTVSSSWVGTNVTVNMDIPSGLFSVTGSMSPFSGTVQLGNSAGSFRFNLGTPSTYDCSRIAFDLGTNSAQLLNRNGNTVITLGSLAGGSNTSLRGAGSVTNFPSTYVIGSNNLSTTFAGSIIDGTPITAQTLIEKVGTGTWTLTGASTFGGGMTVDAGALRVNNTSGSATGEGPLEILAGATLTGTGTVDSASTLDDYSYLAPSDPTGTLTFTGDLTLNDNTILSFGLGTNSDSVAVGGDLFLTGKLQVSNAGGFGPGTYTLFTCAGTLTYDNFTLASAPPGFNYSINTNTPGVVSLVVTLPAPPSINNIAIIGGNLVLSGSGGPSNATFYVLNSTNLTTPLSNWTPFLTNQFDVSGNFNLTNPVDLTAPQSFYLLQLP